MSVKQGQTVRVGFVADYSVACGNILTDDGAWTSADPTTVSVAQDVTNPLLATVGGVKVGGPVLVKFVGGPRGIAALTATVQVTVTAANR